MQKITSLFQRNYDGDRLVHDEVVPGSEWVLEGEGIATRKWDGTCCLVQDGEYFKRYDAKGGKQPPAGFMPAQEPDPITGHWPGWMIVGDGPEDKYHREPWVGHYDDGTYELIGPKIQGNPEKWPCHALVRHGEFELEDVPRNFEGIKAYLAATDIEGIVWHHPLGHKVKIKTKDFGLRRP